jgi:hypothetical protein
MGKRKKLLLKIEDMGRRSQVVLEEHPVTDALLVMFDELTEYCEEILALKKRMGQIDRSSEEFYRLMARLETLLMGLGLTAQHLADESERMDELFKEDG